MLIPQSLAYALLPGLPPEAGALCVHRRRSLLYLRFWDRPCVAWGLWRGVTDDAGAWAISPIRGNEGFAVAG